MADDGRPARARLHVSTFVLYGLVALAATWPLARDFSTWLLGDVPYDQRHTIWILWHTKEALLGRQPWFTANLLYYPHGISTLVDGVGPVSGLLALPFWYLPSSISSNSAVAAYNGATWLGFTLSGVCMYALARVGVKMDRFAAFFAGLLFMMWPSHVVSLYGHLEKAFVGLLPLTVLAAILAYDPARSRALADRAGRDAARDAAAQRESIHVRAAGHRADRRRRIRQRQCAASADSLRDARGDRRHPRHRRDRTAGHRAGARHARSEHGT